jgi:hypothetical protein
LATFDSIEAVDGDVGAVTVRVGDGTGEFRLPDAQTIEEVARRVRPRVGLSTAAESFKSACIDCIDGLLEGEEGMGTAGGADDVAKGAGANNSWWEGTGTTGSRGSTSVLLLIRCR